MNKIAITFFGLVLLFASACSKTETNPTANENDTTQTGGGGGGGGTNPTYYFTFKANGVLQDFKAMTLIKDDPNNIKQFYLVGQKSEKDLPNLLFTLNYKSPGWVDGLSYVLDENDFVNFAEYKTPAELVFKSKAAPASPNTGLRIKFDKIVLAAGEYASGTFSGTLQLEENLNTVVITEGKFKCKFLN
jgi:hypothetical protein